MRQLSRVVPILLCGLVSGAAVLVTVKATAGNDLRRSTVLLAAAVGLAALVATLARRWWGASAGVAIWLAVAPLAEAIRRVMGRSVEAFVAADSLYRGVSGSGEWRLDTPLRHGMWRQPSRVVAAWSIVGLVVGAVVVGLARRVRRPTLVAAWGAFAASLALVLAAILHTRAPVAIPLVHRATAVGTTLAALVLLLWPGRGAARRSVWLGPYRSTETVDALRDEGTWVRASAALAVAALGAAPLAAWVDAGVW